ncbi:MAG: MFS transporter [Thermoplasmatota archaeon]|nr:MFS transporter [Candidatus Thermoplasmatota archaeon]MBU1915205.1 MFS transporter [Candidatus Thermoplasmatota archaeon]
MFQTQFRHYVIELAHRHGHLIAVQAFVAVANTLANSFALIYLVRQGASYLECSVFVLIAIVVSLLLVSFASRTIVKNFSSSVTTALVCLAGYYLLLMTLHGWPLVVIPPVFFGTYVVTFWVPYNVLIMHITSRAKRGAIIGFYFLIFPLVGVLTPALGGLIILLSGYQALFAIAAILAVANIVFIFGLKVFREMKHRIIIPELLESLKINMIGRLHIDIDFKAVDWRLRTALFAEGIQDGIFWIFIPLVSFEFAKSEIGAGGYLSLFAVWGAIMTIALGYLSDRLKDRASIVRIGAAFAAISVLVASSATDPARYLSSMSMAFFWIAMVPSFLFTMLLDKMEKLKKKGVIVREFLLDSGRLVGVLATIILLLLNVRLADVMVIAGVALATIIIVR